MVADETPPEPPPPAEPPPATPVPDPSQTMPPPLYNAPRWLRKQRGEEE